MANIRQTNYHYCQTCGKQLQAYRCYNCHGNGTTKFLLLFSRACETCNGSGKLYQCPDQSFHSRASESKIFSDWMGIQPMVDNRMSKQKCWKCSGTGWVQKSVHIPRPTDILPRYPRVYKQMTVRCSSCNGSGWIE